MSVTKDDRRDTRQPFQLYPHLYAEIDRMAKTGVGSHLDWDRFLSALNDALTAAQSAQPAPALPSHKDTGHE